MLVSRIACIVLFATINCSGIDAPALTDPTRREFERLLRMAEDKLEAGDLEGARHLFTEADRIELVEAPNYEALAGLAECDCRLGALSDGRSRLSELQCMIDVEFGTKRCPNSTESGTAAIVDGDVWPLCLARMCQEMFLSYYGSPTPQLIRRLDSIRDRAKRASIYCQ